MDDLTDKEVEKMLNPDNDSEDWPEFETIKDGVVDFMSDLPIEVYEHLYRAVHKKEDKEALIKHLFSFDADKKKCFNHCPKCGVDTEPESGQRNIFWGAYEWTNWEANQNGTCQKCGCEFKEFYTYDRTEIDE